MPIRLRVPHPDYAESFRAFSNYFEDLANLVGGLYGHNDYRVPGVCDGVERHLASRRIQRRRLSTTETEDLERALRKCWGMLRRAYREVEDPDYYDEEANALLPVHAYYAGFHAILAYCVACGQTPPRDHRSTRSMVANNVVVRELVPYPWSAYCEGCPQTGSHRFGAVNSPSPVHVLSRIDPTMTEDRLAMFLRTTRERLLEEKFDEYRRRGIRPGRRRRNVSRREKERMAGNLHPTTMWDIFWRLRKEAHYGDADKFVLGASGTADARRFGQALLAVTDATVAALEGVMGAYVGPQPIAQASDSYARQSRSTAPHPIGIRANYWNRKVAAAEAPF